MKKTIVFTDLDGTLLDEATYSHAEALPALHLIFATSTPLVFCSSKTRAEMVMLREQMNNIHPFIAENGGGIFIPCGYFGALFEAEAAEGYHLLRLGTPYGEIRNQFVQLRDKFHAKVRGFADMAVAEIAALTGLDEGAAALARQRDFDEPFIFDGEPDENFLRAIEAEGLCWTQGRIFHIMGRHDKGRAVDRVLAFYRQQFGELVSIALGDSLNDLPMLAAVDHPVLIRHRDGSHDHRIAMNNLLKTELAGPAGWNEAMMQMLKLTIAIPERQNLLDI